MVRPFLLKWLPAQEGMAAGIDDQPQAWVLLRQLVLAALRHLLVLHWVHLHPPGHSKLSLPLWNLPAHMFVVTIRTKQRLFTLLFCALATFV